MKALQILLLGQINFSDHGAITLPTCKTQYKTGRNEKNYKFPSLK